ncbi:MAG: HAD family hydrolase [Deltaproteobacteria bacterium]|nr:HAD family hydrolase [Deltaproteobacteria bacterium]
MSEKAVFIDKDGTLIENVPFNIEPELIRLSPNCVAGLRMLYQAGYKFVVVSNQDGVARGYFREADLERVRRCLEELLGAMDVPLTGFYCCPHHPDGIVKRYRKQCDCRKPMPGLLLRAARRLDLDLSASWMVGDILNDIEAGKRAGCRTILINNGNEREWRVDNSLRKPDYLAQSINSAASIITAFSKRDRYLMEHLRHE